MSIKRNPFPNRPKLEYDESMMKEPESWTIITALNRVTYGESLPLFV